MTNDYFLSPTENRSHFVVWEKFYSYSLLIKSESS